MIITKDQVLTALKNEPLAAGSWIRPAADSSLQQCEVCAVGAVMRHVFFKHEENFNDDDFVLVCRQVTKGKYVFEKPLTLINNGNYLGALSCLFEHIQIIWDSINDIPLVVTPEIRTQLIDFVISNFPEEFEVEFKYNNNNKENK